MAEVLPCRARWECQCAHRHGRRAQRLEGPVRGLAAPGLALLAAPGLALLAALGRALQGLAPALLPPGLALPPGLVLPAQPDLQERHWEATSGGAYGIWLMTG